MGGEVFASLSGLAGSQRGDRSLVAVPLADEAARQAARVLDHRNFTVLEENWRSGRHRLTVIATPGGGILAGAEVRSPESGFTAGCLTALTADRVTATAQALRAWNSQHGSEFGELWFVIVTSPKSRRCVDPEPTGSMEDFIAFPSLFQCLPWSELQRRVNSYCSS